MFVIRNKELKNNVTISNTNHFPYNLRRMTSFSFPSLFFNHILSIRISISQSSFIFHTYKNEGSYNLSLVNIPSVNTHYINHTSSILLILVNILLEATYYTLILFLLLYHHNIDLVILVMLSHLLHVYSR